MKKKKSVHIRI